MPLLGNAQSACWESLGVQWAEEDHQCCFAAQHLTAATPDWPRASLVPEVSKARQIRVALHKGTGKCRLMERLGNPVEGGS